MTNDIDGLKLFTLIKYTYDKCRISLGVTRPNTTLVQCRLVSQISLIFFVFICELNRDVFLYRTTSDKNSNENRKLKKKKFQYVARMNLQVSIDSCMEKNGTSRIFCYLSSKHSYFNNVGTH